MDEFAVLLIATGTLMMMAGWGVALFKLARINGALAALVMFVPAALVPLTVLDWRELWRVTAVWLVGWVCVAGGVAVLKAYGDPEDYVMIGAYLEVEDDDLEVDSGSRKGGWRPASPEETTPFRPGTFVQTGDARGPASGTSDGAVLIAAAAGGGMLVFCLAGFGVWTLLGPGRRSREIDDGDDLQAIVPDDAPPRF